uniref:Uncharacterized protein n=1 Tax=Physcomitrium patens TaxID=3218 RepID=A0A7I4EY04_PHYPA
MTSTLAIGFRSARDPSPDFLCFLIVLSVPGPQALQSLVLCFSYVAWLVNVLCSIEGCSSILLVSAISVEFYFLGDMV